MVKRSPLTFDVTKLSSVPSTVETGLQATTQTDKHADIQPRKRANKEIKGRTGRHFIAAHVLPEAAKQFKLLVVQQERTTQSMLIEAINDMFVKYGLSRIADE